MIAAIEPPIDPHVVQSVVVGTDGSATAARAVARAGAIAARCGAVLHVVTAYRAKLAPVGAPDACPWETSPGAQADRIATAAVAEMAALGVEAVAHSEPGGVVDVLVSVADEVGADLLVVGNQGPQGLARLVTSAVAGRVSRHAHCDVMVVDTSSDSLASGSPASPIRVASA